jgi:prophage antirepressor-like protein
MNIETQDFANIQIRYIQFDNMIIFNTKDICKALGINYSERVNYHVILGNVCCDLQTAYEISLDNETFTNFLNQHFGDFQTTVESINISNLDEDWNNK